MIYIVFHAEKKNTDWHKDVSQLYLQLTIFRKRVAMIRFSLTTTETVTTTSVNTVQGSVFVMFDEEEVLCRA